MIGVNSRNFFVMLHLLIMTINHETQVTKNNFIKYSSSKQLNLRLGLRPFYP